MPNLTWRFKIEINGYNCRIKLKKTESKKNDGHEMG